MKRLFDLSTRLKTAALVITRALVFLCVALAPTFAPTRSPSLALAQTEALTSADDSATEKLYRAANEAVEREDYDEAKSLIERALENSPGNKKYKALSDFIEQKQREAQSQQPQSPTSVPTAVVAAGSVNGIVPNGVEEIDDETFENHDELRRVVLPPSVKVIGEGAFSNCYELSDISIQEGLRAIGVHAFLRCRSLTTVLLPQSLETIEYHAFEGCGALKTITIPRNVTAIGTEAFCFSNVKIDVEHDNENYSSNEGSLLDKSGQTLLHAYIDPETGVYATRDGVREIGDGAFRGNGYARKIVVSEGVEKIGEYAFWGCPNLEVVVLPATVTEIHVNALTGIGAVIEVDEKNPLYASEAGALFDKSKETLLRVPDNRDFRGYVIPTSVKSIGPFAFEDSEYLVGVVIPEGVESIGHYAFAECEELRSVELPKSVVEIGRLAFYNCGSLDKITIPETVETIAHDAFEDCPAVMYVYAGSYAERWAQEHKRDYKKIVDQAGLYYVKQVEDGIAITGFDRTDTRARHVIPGELEGLSVVEISESAFAGARRITSLSFMEGVRVLGEDAFADCSGLVKVALPNGLVTIGAGAFHGCTKLSTVTFAPSVTSIGARAFEDCRALDRVSIPRAVEEIGAGAFTYTGAKIEVDDENEKYSASEGALYDKTQTTLLYYPKDDAEHECAVQSGVKTIGSLAFCALHALRSVRIPASVVEIADDAFDDCPAVLRVDSGSYAETWAKRHDRAYEIVEKQFIKPPTPPEDRKQIELVVIAALTTLVLCVVLILRNRQRAPRKTNALEEEGDDIGDDKEATTSFTQMTSIGFDDKGELIDDYGDAVKSTAKEALVSTNGLAEREFYPTTPSSENVDSREHAKLWPRAQEEEARNSNERLEKSAPDERADQAHDDDNATTKSNSSAFDASTAVRERVDVSNAPTNAGANAPTNINSQKKRATAGEVATLTILGVKVRMRWVPKGEFKMGADDSEAGRRSDETERITTIKHGFWMAETPTTQALWRAVMGNNPSAFAGDELPVETVSWDECQEFIRRLNSGANKVKNFIFTLPTEAQWERACRAGGDDAYSFGSAGDSTLMNCRVGRENASNQTTNVRSYPPNAFGLYDMHGNVREWCADEYERYDMNERVDPVGRAKERENVKRSCRGGSWRDLPERCRAAARAARAPECRENYLGFRIILYKEALK